MNLSKSDLDVLNHPDGIVFPDGTTHEFTPEEKVAETIKIKEATKHTKIRVFCVDCKNYIKKRHLFAASEDLCIINSRHINGTVRQSYITGKTIYWGCSENKDYDCEKFDPIRKS